jgi:hypothetical protein
LSLERLAFSCSNKEVEHADFVNALFEVEALRDRKAISDKVDSLFPQRESFRLTPEGTGTFTEKLALMKGFS